MIKIAPVVRKGISCSSQAEAKTKALNAEKAALTVLASASATTLPTAERRGGTRKSTGHSCSGGIRAKSLAATKYSWKSGSRINKDDLYSIVNFPDPEEDGRQHTSVFFEDVKANRQQAKKIMKKL